MCVCKPDRQCRHVNRSPSASRWFEARTAGARGRILRVLIVTLARKLLVALWRYADTSLVARRRASPSLMTAPPCDPP